MYSIKSGVVMTGFHEAALFMQQRAPEIYHEETIAALHESASITLAQVVGFTPVGASKGGGLRGAWYQEINNDALIARIRNPRKHAEAVEVGSRPHMPPVAALEMWGIVVLGQHGLGWPLAMAIRERGTRGYGMMARGEKAARPHVYEAFRQSVLRIERRCNVALKR